MTATSPIARPPPRAVLLSLRFAAFAGLALGLSFVADVFALSLLRPSVDFLRGLFYFGWMPAVKPAVIPGIVLILVSLGMYALAGWRLWLRGKDSLIFSLLLVAGVSVVDLSVMAFLVPGVMDPLTALLSQNHAGDFGLVIGIVCAIPLVVTFLVFRVRSWGWIGGSYAALAVILVYLSTDEPRHGPPLAFEQISPVLPGDSAGYDVLMRYGKYHPLGKNFREPLRIFHGPGRWVNASKPAEWTAWLKLHHADVDADWVELAPVRAWIDELNTFDRLADLMPADIRAEIITFGPLRSYTNHACDIAGQQALDGHGDAAIATLLPLLQVSRKLEPSARSLVRAMSARVMQDNAIATARYVLDHAPVSPEMRIRLVDSLTLGVGGEAGVRHLLSIESTFFFVASADRSLGDFIPPERRSNLVRASLNATSPFLYNRWRTVNRQREFAESIQDLAAHRDLAGLKQVEHVFSDEHTKPKFKNLLGDFIVGASVPSYQKVAEAYWRIEDSRVQLLAQLTRPSPSTGQAMAVLAP